MGNAYSIPNPCSKRWEELDGDGRERRWEICGKSVHALAAYTDDEISRLREENRDKLCVYEGSLPQLTSSGRRVLLAGALLSAITPLFGQSDSARLVIVDATGARIPFAGAVVEMDAEGKVKSRIRADDQGEILMSGHSAGVYRVRIEVPGFKFRILWINLQPGKEFRSEVRLEVGTHSGLMVTSTKQSENPKR